MCLHIRYVEYVMSVWVMIMIVLGGMVVVAVWLWFWTRPTYDLIRMNIKRHTVSETIQ